MRRLIVTPTSHSAPEAEWLAACRSPGLSLGLDWPGTDGRHLLSISAGGRGEQDHHEFRASGSAAEFARAASMPRVRLRPPSGLRLVGLSHVRAWSQPAVGPQRDNGSGLLGEVRQSGTRMSRR